MLHPTLPPEIINYILGFLHGSFTETDYGTLHCCSVALSICGLGYLADSWLYREMRVYTRPEDETEGLLGLSVMEFRILLAGGLNAISEQISGGVVGGYVQSLIIILPPRTGDEPLQAQPLGDAELIPLFLLGPSNPLPVLRSVTLTTTGDGTVPWGAFTDSFRRDFVMRLAWKGDSVGRGVLAELKLERIEGFPVRVLEGCTGLRKVHLEGNLELSPQSLPQTKSGRANLQHLSIYHCGESLIGLADLLAGQNSMASRLRSLDFRSYQEKPIGLAFLPKILQACQGALEVLTLDWGIDLFCSAITITPSTLPSNMHIVSSGDDPLATFLPLQTLPALKKLIIHTAIVTMCRSEPRTRRRHTPFQLRRYQTCFREIGEALKTIWVGVNSDGDKGVRSLREVELILDIELRGEEAPTVADVDFEPLLSALPSSPTTGLSQAPTFVAAPPLSGSPIPPPLVTLNIRSATKWSTWRNSSATTTDISFDNILADLKNNIYLGSLIENRRVKVVDGLD